MSTERRLIGDTVRLFWSRLLRTRRLAGIALLIALMIGYDVHLRGDSPELPWWSTLITTLFLVIAMASYDAFASPRADGSLRTVLLTSVSRRALSVGSSVAAMLVAIGTAVAFLVYLSASGAAQLAGTEFGVALLACLVWAGAAAAFVHCCSLAMHRDAVAVLMLMLLFLGSRPLDAPMSSLPEAVRVVLRLLDAMLPLPHHLAAVLGRPRASTFWIASALQLAGFTLLAAKLLDRDTLLRRLDSIESAT